MIDSKLEGEIANFKSQFNDILDKKVDITFIQNQLTTIFNILEKLVKEEEPLNPMLSKKP